MTTMNDSTRAPRLSDDDLFAAAVAIVASERAPRPTWAPLPATCEHTDRPAWPPSETQLCHECEDRKFRAAMWTISAANFHAAAGQAVSA